MERSTRNYIASAVLGLIVISAFGFFHVVLSPFCLIPKHHFTFSMTFVSVNDIISRYNNRSIGERVRGDELLDHLVAELQANNIVQTMEPGEFTPEQEGL